MKHQKIVLIITAAMTCLLSPLAVFTQAEKLGIVNYTPPKGWTKTAKENIVAYSEINKSGTFCIITLYGATPGTGSAQKDFAREWNNLVVKPLGAAIEPKTETETVDAWTAIAGGAAVDFQGAKAVAFLTVLSDPGRTVSILGVFNDESYLAKLVAFNASIETDKVVVENPVVNPVRPLPQAPVASQSTMHAADLVKEFESNEVRAIQAWVGRRARIYGTVNSIEVGTDGRIALTFKSSIATYGNARCYFSSSQASRVAALSAHREATVEGTVRGWEGGYSRAKVFLLLENCIVP